MSCYCLLFQNASSADTLSSRGKTEDYETKVVSNPVNYSTIQWRESEESGRQYWSILTIIPSFRDNQHAHCVQGFGNYLASFFLGIGWFLRNLFKTCIPLWYQSVNVVLVKLVWLLFWPVTSKFILISCLIFISHESLFFSCGSKIKSCKSQGNIKVQGTVCHIVFFSLSLSMLMKIQVIGDVTAVVG